MHNPGEETRRRRPRSILRIVSLLVGIFIVVGGGLAVMNLVATDANGASAAAADDATAGEEAPKKKAGKGEEGEEKEKEPVPVEVAEVTTGSVSSYITSSANLVAENQVKILAEVEGRVSRLLVEEGDRVRQGEHLALLVRDDQEIALKKAQLKQANALQAYERGKDLAAKELISREELDALTIDYEIAREELAEAEWSLGKTVIRAPFSGRVTDRKIQVGQHMRPGDELFEVTDFEPLIARIFLPERDVIGLEAGRDVQIRLNADASIRFDGRIRQISPVVDTATGTIKVTIEAVDPPRMVRPGSFVAVGIVRETRPNALLVPRQAVVRELQTAHVFVVEGEVASKRPLTLGLEENGLVEAVSGLESGEQVIVAGQGGLKDQAAVRVLEPAAAKAG